VEKKKKDIIVGSFIVALILTWGINIVIWVFTGFNDGMSQSTWWYVFAALTILFIMSSRESKFDFKYYLTHNNISVSEDMNINSGNALIHACEVGKLPVVKGCIEAGADVRYNGDSPIGIACRDGHKEVAEYLLSKGADGDWGICKAIEAGHKNIIELLTNKVNLNNALLHAQRNKMYQVAEYIETILLKRKPNIDRNIVLDAVKKDGMAIKDIHYSLRNDSEIAYEAVKQNSDALEYVSDELKNDPKFKYKLEWMHKTTHMSDLRLSWGSIKLDDFKQRDYVLEAVKKRGFDLEYASEELRNVREIVIEAIKEEASALKYASDELRNDREIVMKAVERKGFALQYASEELCNDREIVLKAVRRDGYALQYASEELCNDREIVLKAVKNEFFAIDFASEELRNDREFMKLVHTIK
jgi:hypothetical protein